MNSLRTIVAVALVAVPAGGVYEPARVRHAPHHGHRGGVHIGEGDGYAPGHHLAPSIGVGIRHDNVRRDERHHRCGWRDRRGHRHH